MGRFPRVLPPLCRPLRTGGQHSINEPVCVSLCVCVCVCVCVCSGDHFFSHSVMVLKGAGITNWQRAIMPNILTPSQIGGVVQKSGGKLPTPPHHHHQQPYFFFVSGVNYEI